MNFPTTQWSVVLQSRASEEEARSALERLCRSYRLPVLAYIRRCLPHSGSAEDLTQGFFLRFIEANYPAAADPLRGRFRAFLLTAVRRFVGHELSRAGALKRGGGQATDSSDDTLTELVSAQPGPEQVFDRAWAMSLVQLAQNRLRAEAIAANKQALYEHLRTFISEPCDAAGYERVAEQLGMRRGTVAVAIHRLRTRLRALVVEELAQTVASKSDLTQELRELRAVLGER